MCGVSGLRSVVDSFLSVTLSSMRGDREDASSDRYGVGARSAGQRSPRLRTAGLAAGFCLAAAATVVVLLTDDAQLLRLAVVAAAWAFVLAALVASRETADSSPVDDDRRSAAEQAMRAELEALRGELAQVGRLREELAQVAELRREVAEVAGLRRDLAGLAGLRSTLEGIDLAPLAELRADVGRLRAELAEQLSGEMLVERVLLRTQSTRTAPAAAGPVLAPGSVEEDRVEPRRAALPPPWDRATLRPMAEAPPPPYVEPEPRRRRTDEPAPTAPPAPAERLTVERPAARPVRPPVPGPVVAAPTLQGLAPAQPDQATRLAQLLAESGLTPPSGGRRRRRYRGDGEDDEVLSRVLGRG
jgi:hypothetical protein